MSERPPDFDELVGGDLEAAERERLQRVHRLLIEAGPPPELSPTLAKPPPEERQRVFALPKRRRWTVLTSAAAAFVLAFGAGYLVGEQRDRAPERTLVMIGTPQAAEARASLAIFAVDTAGNWPMELTVRRLAPLPEHETYELWLVKAKKLKKSCGAFTVERVGDTVVPLNAPFDLREYDGWVVVRSGTTTPLLTTT